MNRAEFVTVGVSRLRTLMVNVYFVESSAGWVLIDAGLPGTAAEIRNAAAELFGGGTHPQAIVLTHGHFDHVGALRTLTDEWRAPIYVHPLELPYVTGVSEYPPPDPISGGGLLALLSSAYPRGPYDFGAQVNVLPENGHVPGLPLWRWLHTPGHTAGHVSFFRESDRTLIAGDAVVTTRQESLRAVLTQRAEVWRPPAYYTQDWNAARSSVEALAMLEPEYLTTGHGTPMRGQPMRDALHHLARNFDAVRPQHGRYVHQPAITDAHGIVLVPPRPPMPASWRVAGAIGALAIGAASVALLRQTRRSAS
jgi:glyoxylase-like metal-dependent hydrolase (beta-lactamase superfamily II)